MRLRAVLVSVILLLPMPMLADSFTYTYTGNDFTNFNASGEPQVYTTSDFVSGEFTLSAPLADYSGGYLDPTSFSFSDGYQTISNINASDPTFYVLTNGEGAIIQWHITMYMNGSSNYDELGTNGTIGSGGADFGQYSDNEFNYASAGINGTGTYGTWSVSTAATPEPASLMLVATWSARSFVPV